MSYPFPPRWRAWMCLVFTRVHNLIDDSWLSHSLKILEFKKGDGVDMCKKILAWQSPLRKAVRHITFEWTSQKSGHWSLFFDWFISWSYQGKSKADREFCSSLPLFSVFTWHKTRATLGYLSFSACIWRTV